MQKWEYDFKPVYESGLGEGWSFEDMCKTMGEAGWELCTLHKWTDKEDTQTQVIFKRPKA